MKLLICLVSMLALPTVVHGATLYLPQIADGNGYVTTITLENPNATPVSGVLSFFNQNGTPRNLSLNGTNSTQFTVLLPGFGSARYSTSGSAAVTSSGWALLESTEAIQAVATFDLRDGGTLVSTAAVFAAQAARRFVMPVEVSATVNAGVAIVNPSSTAPLTVRFQLIAESGTNFLTAVDSRFNPLAPLSQVADFVTSTFPSSAAGFRGTLVAEVVGQGEMAATALVVKEGKLSAIPVTPLTGADSVVILGNATPSLDQVARRLTDQGLPARLNALPFAGSIVLFAVSAVDGPMPQTRDALTRSVGEDVSAGAILMFDLSPNTDPELRQLVILEMRELLTQYIGQEAARGLKVLMSDDANLADQIRALRLPVKIKNPG